MGGKNEGMPPTLRSLAGAALVAGALSACPAALASAGAAVPVHPQLPGTCGPTNGPGQAPWPQFDADPAHSGDGVGITHPAGPLHKAWETPPLDGAMYGQPLFAGGCIFVATEDDSVYALDQVNGAVRWHVHLAAPVTGGLPCGNINPSGITGTPVLNPATGNLFVVVLTDFDGSPGHELVELRSRTGQVVREERFALPGTNPAAEQQRAALVQEDGNVYASLGGLFGDCNTYKGFITSIPQAGGPPGYWHVPTQNQAGIWEPGGPDLLPNGDLLVADGNGAAAPGKPFDGSNAVFEISPALKELSVFAPTNWAQLNQSDGDLGSTAPAVLPGGLAFQVGKQGVGYLLDLSHLGGVGGQLASTQVCMRTGAWGADAVSGATVYVPCNSGEVAVKAVGRSLHILWTSSGGEGSLMLAGGRLFLETNGGNLMAFDPASGRVLQTLNFASPVTDFGWVVALDNTLYTADGTRLVALGGV